MVEELRFDAPSWKILHKMLFEIWRKIATSGFQPEVVMGISRGGWIPARILSDFLENTNLASVKVESYLTIGTKTSPRVTQSISTDVSKKNVLLVDEIADSGESLALAKKHVIDSGAGEVKTVACYCKQCCDPIPDYYAKITNLWIVFPWEVKETIRQIINLYGNDTKRVDLEIAHLSSIGGTKELTTKILQELLGRKS